MCTKPGHTSKYSLGCAGVHDEILMGVWWKIAWIIGILARLPRTLETDENHIIFGIVSLLDAFTLN